MENISKGLNLRDDRINTNVIAIYSLAHDVGHALESKGMPHSRFIEKRKAETQGLPASNVSDFLRKHPNSTPEEMSSFLKAYRALPSEVRADQFAFKFMSEHPDLLI